MNCKNCSVELKSYQGKYCSNKCQKELERKKLIEVWLETGICVTSSRRGHYVRDFIHEEQNGLCAICSCSDEWCDKELIFILDHIDGNSENNARENLRLVCPNCDSQLPTYKAKNYGKGRHSRRQRYAEGKSF